MPYTDGGREKHFLSTGRGTYGRPNNLGTHVEISNGLQADEYLLFGPFALRG